MPTENSDEELAAGKKPVTLYDAGSGTLLPDGQVLTFTTTNWHVPQTIYVVAEDDAAAEDSQKQVAESLVSDGSASQDFTLQRTPLAIEVVRLDGQKLRSTEFSLAGDVLTIAPLVAPAFGAAIDVEYLVPNGAQSIEAVRHSISESSAANFVDVKIPLVVIEVVDDEAAGVVITPWIRAAI